MFGHRKLKYFLIFAIGFLYFVLIITRRKFQNELIFSQAKEGPPKEKHGPNLFEITPLICHLGDLSIPDCFLINRSTAVIPLSFVKSYFEISANVDPSSRTLQMRHTDVPIPQIPLDVDYQRDLVTVLYPRRSVEDRTKVKLVLADEGVPLSLQWDIRGYTYPIQIAQFGLWHYSQFVHLKTLFGHKESSMSSSDLFDLDLLKPMDGIHYVFAPSSWTPVETTTGGYKFSVSDNPAYWVPTNIPALTIRFPEPAGQWKYFILSGHSWHPGSFIAIHLSLWPSNNRKWLVYKCAVGPRSADIHLSVSSDKSVATFWMPRCASPDQADFTGHVLLSRDLTHDVSKPFNLRLRRNSDGAPMSNHFNLTISEIQFYAGSVGPHGGGIVTEMRLGNPSTTKSAHAELLFHKMRMLASADWLLRNQDSHGVWRTLVPRVLRGRQTIKPGWPSAMGQGLAISLLARLYNLTNDKNYLHSAERSLAAFDQYVSHGGVRSLFLNNTAIPWFEEYPTEPGTHVLNGFIFSLLGLHDMLQINGSSNASKHAGELWSAGLNSLSRILPLFDSGSGSLYDLRHVQCDSDAIMHPLLLGPNRAAWSYHALHIRQLYELAQLDPEHAQQWLQTAKRWSAYMNGERSPHN